MPRAFEFPLVGETVPPEPPPPFKSSAASLSLVIVVSPPLPPGLEVPTPNVPPDPTEILNTSPGVTAKVP